MTGVTYRLSSIFFIIILVTGAHTAYPDDSTAKITGQKLSRRLGQSKTTTKNKNVSPASLFSNLPSIMNILDQIKESSIIEKYNSKEAYEENNRSLGLFNRKRGITFKHSVAVNDLMANETLHYSLDFDGDYCKDSDKYGDNDCYFGWGSTMSATLSPNIVLYVDEGLEVELDLEIFAYGTIPISQWSSSCHLCSESGEEVCSFDPPDALSALSALIPFADVEFPQYACPYMVNNTKELEVSEDLPDESPLGSFVTLLIQGHISLKDEIGDTKFKVKFSIDVD
eukprot:CAMPEP_0172483420 /NCGR_PEP_ID=MMETSP1066-20121228/10439_1 /TAXON_ID=671091 /ORGANISM="Coscinodiscus wailesii, Strain CCMP2513" /LENGTH=282 /DNA_ID=CAMNT_0013247299 /DNA_START=85 /DNA_END=933 /DNA_ORIENTATION=-